MLKLIIEDDEGRKTVVPFVRDEITIGRQEGNTIRLTERNVSRKHARLLRQSSTVTVEDLGSYNGIRINGDRITGQVPVRDGDLIQIGDYDLAIQNEDATGAVKAGETPTVPLQPATNKLPKLSQSHMSETMPALPTVSEPAADEDIPEASADDVTAPAEDMPARPSNTAVIRSDAVQGNRAREQLDLDPSESPRLVVMNTEFAGREFTCAKTELRIGRTDENDFALDHRSLSRTHCKIVRENNGEWRVIDMQSANGLLVNGEPYAQVTVRSGDVIELGHVKLKFLSPGESFTLPSEGKEKAPVGGKSKAPFIALAVVMVLAIAVVGVMTLKGNDVAKDPIPAPPKVKPTQPEVKVDPKPDVAPVPDKAPAETPEQIIARAQKMFEAGDLQGTSEALKLVEGNSGATPLLNDVTAEKIFRAHLDEADKALQANNLKEARTSLEKAAKTKAFKPRFQELTEAIAAKAKEATALVKNANDVPPNPVPVAPKVVPPAGPSNSEIAAGKLEDATRLIKEKQDYKGALLLLNQCIKADPTLYNCYTKKGGALAKLGKLDDAMMAYEQFLKLAPADNPSRAKLQTIVDDYKAQKNGQ